MYMPTLGRFLSRDPSLVDVDLLSDNNAFGRQLDAMFRQAYVYAANSPTNKIDPSGLDAEPALPLFPAEASSPICRPPINPVDKCGGEGRPRQGPKCRKGEIEILCGLNVSKFFCVRCRGDCEKPAEDCLPVCTQEIGEPKAGCRCKVGPFI